EFRRVLFRSEGDGREDRVVIDRDRAIPSLLLNVKPAVVLDEGPRILRHAEDHAAVSVLPLEEQPLAVVLSVAADHEESEDDQRCAEQSHYDRAPGRRRAVSSRRGRARWSEATASGSCSSAAALQARLSWRSAAA